MKFEISIKRDEQYWNKTNWTVASGERPHPILGWGMAPDAHAARANAENFCREYAENYHPPERYEYEA